MVKKDSNKQMTLYIFSLHVFQFQIQNRVIGLEKNTKDPFRKQSIT